MLFFWFYMKNSIIYENDDIIKKNMMFYSFNDFFFKKNEIKEEYNLLSLREKRIYKLYVYSMSFENEFAKDLIWEFLNSVDYTELGIFQEWGRRQRKGGRKWVQ